MWHVRVFLCEHRRWLTRRCRVEPARERARKGCAFILAARHLKSEHPRGTLPSAVGSHIMKGIGPDAGNGEPAVTQCRSRSDSLKHGSSTMMPSSCICNDFTSICQPPLLERLTVPALALRRPPRFCSIPGFPRRWMAQSCAAPSPNDSSECSR